MKMPVPDELKHGLFRPSPFARSIARSLLDKPKDWAWDHVEYRIRHKSGVAVWVANKAFALHVEHPSGRRIYEQTSARGTRDQRLIWDAFRQWRSPEDVRIPGEVLGLLDGRLVWPKTKENPAHAGQK